MVRALELVLGLLAFAGVILLAYLVAPLLGVRW